MRVSTNEVARQITVIIAGAFDFTLQAAQMPHSNSEINGIQTIKPAQLKFVTCKTSADGNAGIATRDERMESVSFIRTTLHKHQRQANPFVGVTIQRVQVLTLLLLRQR